MPDSDLLEQSTTLIRTKIDREWQEIRKSLQDKKGVLSRVREYNHPTNAYRDAKKIKEGTHKHFTETGKWLASVVCTDRVILGTRSKKPTYVHELYMIYIGD